MLVLVTSFAFMATYTTDPDKEDNWMPLKWTNSRSLWRRYFLGTTGLHFHPIKLVSVALVEVPYKSDFI